MWSRTCAKILAYVTYLDKYQKTYQAPYLLPNDFPYKYSDAWRYWNRMKEVFFKKM